MKRKASEVLADFKSQGVIQSLTGPDNLITGIASIEHCGAGDLVFVEQQDSVEPAVRARPAAIVTTVQLAGQFTDLAGTSLLLSDNVRLAQALLRQAYVDRDLHATGWPRIHPRSVVHESVQVPETAVIGPGAVLGQDVTLGERAVIMANAVIEEGAAIGAESVVHPNAVVGYNCEIGERSIIKSGCVIGMEGFGFAQDSKRKSHRIPQLGKVVIGNDVVLGANCTVDRAAYHETRIADGCKIDALCHIAHNVDMQEDCLIVAQTGIAGSTTIGKRVMCSGQTGILDHLKVADDVVLVQRAGVIQDMDKPGIYAGLPPQPVRQYFKNAALIQQLGAMKTRLNALEKKFSKQVEDE